jgi:hypothetical protein
VTTVTQKATVRVDTTPPRLRLLTRSVRRNADVVLSAADRGSGVDRSLIFASIDGTLRAFRFSGSRIRVDTHGVGRGRHTLRVAASDYQEAKNMENVPRILPNTRVLRVRFTIR